MNKLLLHSLLLLSMSKSFAYTPELFPAQFCWYGKSCPQENKVYDINCPQRDRGISYCNPKYTSSYRLHYIAFTNEETGKKMPPLNYNFTDEKGGTIFGYYSSGVYYKGQKVCNVKRDTGAPYVDDNKPCPFFIDGPIRYLTGAEGNVMGIHIVLDHFEGNEAGVGKGWVMYKGQKLFYERGSASYGTDLLPDTHGQKEFKELIQQRPWIPEMTKRFFDRLQKDGALKTYENKRASDLAKDSQPVEVMMENEYSEKDPLDPTKLNTYRARLRLDPDDVAPEWPSKEAKARSAHIEPPIRPGQLSLSRPEVSFPDPIYYDGVGEKDVLSWYDASPFFRDLIHRCFSDEMQRLEKTKEYSASPYINFYLKESKIYYPLEMVCSMSLSMSDRDSNTGKNYAGISLTLTIQRASAGMTNNDSYIWLY